MTATDGYVWVSINTRIVTPHMFWLVLRLPGLSRLPRSPAKLRGNTLAEETLPGKVHSEAGSHVFTSHTLEQFYLTLPLCSLEFPWILQIQICYRWAVMYVDKPVFHIYIYIHPLIAVGHHAMHVYNSWAPWRERCSPAMAELSKGTTRHQLMMN